MTKVAKDVLHDNSHALLYKIAQAVDNKLPDYVLDGVPLTKEAAAEAPDALFADSRNRRFPISDRANTWLSAAYFAKTAGAAYESEDYQRIAKTLLKAAKAYGITKDVETAMGTLSEQAVKAAEARSEALAKAAEACYGEPETRGFPMFTKVQVKLACSYFCDNAYAYDGRRREKIAKNILRKAAEYGIEAPETVRKEAGAGFPRRDFLAENLLTRETELMRRGLPKMASDMRKTIKVILEATPEDLLNQLDALREMISGTDELSGIDKDYGRRFLPPADFLYDLSDKDAKDFQEDTVPVGGELLSAKALAGLPKRIFERVLGSEGVKGLFEDGKMSPKRISITIVKMKPTAQRGLLSAIKDFTDGAGGDFEEDAIDTSDKKVKEIIDESGKGEVKEGK